MKVRLNFKLKNFMWYNAIRYFISKVRTNSDYEDFALLLLTTSKFKPKKKKTENNLLN